MAEKKILVSACLLGEQVRWDGEILTNCPVGILEWEMLGLVIPVCPEVAGGLPVPRSPAEIQGGDGEDVVEGKAGVFDINGRDVTAAFLAGAREALRVAEEHEVVCAVLKANSPSCGSKMTYDGSFSHKLMEGLGVTAALLKKRGIPVFNEDQIDLVEMMISG